MFVVVIVVVLFMCMVNSIDFVDEYDIWCVFFGLFEYVVDMWCVYIDEYFNKVGFWDGEEWYVCFVCDCMC